MKPFTKLIETKYIITKDKTLKNNRGFDVNLKKGDIIQGISITTSGDISNDSGTQSLKFTDKNNNLFSIGISFRGFEPFYEEYKDKTTLPSADSTNKTDASGETFIQKHKNHLLILGGLVIGYLAYKKFNK